jgi:hypothetical protein
MTELPHLNFPMRDGMAYINPHQGGLEYLIPKVGMSNPSPSSSFFFLNVLKCMDVISACSKA